jgi:hypothetical protein
MGKNSKKFADMGEYDGADEVRIKNRSMSVFFIVSLSN